MALQNVASTEQHSDVLNEAIQSPTPPSYEEEMYLPNYEEALSDQVPGFPASSLILERDIKFMCSYADALVEQRIQLGQDVLALDIGIEQTLIHACAIYPVTLELFQGYIHQHRVYLILAGYQWARVLRGNEDIEWGVEREEVTDDEIAFDADDETDDETDYETDNDKEPSQMMGSRIEG
ncbi:uncharacterized protein EAE97_011921 [Botrytis byssoidea]|uniref:Uncharacterized protein n=1 Tax=Botrytis byssoidea TaxID=139641 RepID=A0A9P5HNK8_9HELO|nr:uncharacterized protein EAE97_011921 [Botrytis byssoidea]KAF7918150.1 hypothetical protein EAE97_011921 [Botrytis byssoidea]